MKKALIITTISGFVPQFEMNNVRILQDLGFEVHYASNFDCPVYDFDQSLFAEQGILIHHLPIEKSPFRIGNNMQAYMELIKLFRQHKFNLVHCHNPMGGVLGRLAGRSHARTCEMLYTAHGFHFYRGAPLKNWLLFYPVERLLAHVTDCIITINKEDYTRAARFHFRKGGMACLIPGVGLDLNRFKPQEGIKSDRKAALGFPEDSYLLVSVGELNGNKNHRTVIRAIADMGNRNIYYAICGRGLGENKLQRLIARKNLEGQVRLMGYRKDIEFVLRGSDCFLFPSKREGFGMAAVEAMAAGVAMITSDCRGTREYMTDGVTGIVCWRNDPAGYAEAIHKLMSNAAEADRMRRAGMERALVFGQKETVRIMRRIYGEILEEHECTNMR